MLRLPVTTRLSVCPACEFGFGALEIPEAEEATFSLPFTALATGTGENEIVLGFF